MGPAPELVGDLLVLGVALGRAPQHGQAHVHQEQALGALAARRAQQQVLRLHVAVHVPGGADLGTALVTHACREHLGTDSSQACMRGQGCCIFPDAQHATLTTLLLMGAPALDLHEANPT